MHPASQAKVIELLKRSYLDLPMASDLPRLTNVTIITDYGLVFTPPSAKEPVLKRLEYIFKSLTLCILGEKAVKSTVDKFQHAFPGDEVTKLQMESFLHSIGGDESPVVQVLRAINQSAIAPANIELKMLLGLANMTKDVKNSWFFEIFVCGKGVKRVVVTSHKREQCIKNNFQYEWVLSFEFNRADLEERIKDEEVEAVVNDLSKKGEDVDLEKSQVNDSDLVTKMRKDSTVCSGQSQGAHGWQCKNEGAVSMGLSSKDEVLELKLPSLHAPNLIKSDNVDSVVAKQEPQRFLHKSRRKYKTGFYRGKRRKCLQKKPTAFNNYAKRTSVKCHSKERKSKSDKSKEFRDSSSNVGDHMQDTVEQNPTSKLDPDHDALASSLSDSKADVLSVGSDASTDSFPSPELSPFNCDNVTLVVSDLMYSLELHKSNHLKIKELEMLLKRYASNEVICYATTRHWEFYPASIDLPALQYLPLGKPLKEILNETMSRTLCYCVLDANAGEREEKNEICNRHLNFDFSPTPNSIRIFPNSMDRKYYANGDVYQGDLKSGIRDGLGQYRYSHGATSYGGGYKAGKKHGEGFFKFKNGAWLRGLFEFGFLVHGVYIFENGDSYVGDFKDENFEGHGQWASCEGDGYDGKWQAGCRHGYGRFTFAGGDIYEGEWMKGNIHGTGKYMFQNGDIYSGKFECGQFHGVGTYTTANKHITGEFSQGRLLHVTNECIS